MKKAKKYAFGGFEGGNKNKQTEARKVNQIPDGYVQEDADPAFPNRQYYRKETNAVAPVTNTVKPVNRPVNRTATSSKIRVRPQIQNTVTPQSTLDRVFLENTPQATTQSPVESPVESFMGDVVVDPSNRAIGRLLNRSRNLSTGAGTNDTGQEAAEFMYTQPDVKGAPVDASKGKYSLNTKELQDIFGTGRVMNKDVSTYKNKGMAKFATGGQVGANMIGSLGEPILDALTVLLDGVPQYSNQPIVNAATMHNMATPYSKFAMGGTVDDLDEDELYQLQEEADQMGISVEELLAQKQEEASNQMTDQEEETPQEDAGENGEEPDEQDLASQFEDAGQEYAMGGQVPIETEGNEIVEHPNGQMQRVIGPSHENGGVDMSVQKGTKIYSDRLAIDGKTMQERKVKREQTIAKLNKLTESNTSTPLKNTIKRTTEINELEDQQDMAIQQVVNNIHNSPKKFASGGFAGDPGEDAPWYQVPLGTAPAGIDTTTGMANPLIGTHNPLSLKPRFTAPITPEGVTSGANMGAGDYVGLAGNLFNAVAPIINTNNARAATRPNINRYLGFGKNALDDNQHAQDYVQGQETNTIKDINTSANSSFARNRGGARSINTVRALDIATEAGKNKAIGGARDSFSRQMVGLLGQRGQLDNQKNAYEMQGQTATDTENQQDLDNYYSNMAQNLTNFGTNIQGVGRSFNKARANQDDIDLMGLGTKNNIKIGRKKGRLSIVNN